MLRLIAGFELPDEGTVELGGVDVTRLPPFSRDVNTVFQDYALFPHMTVADNVAYGLRIKKVPKRERAERVAEVLERVRLEELGGRKPAQLSGGQRQRVALARAIVNRPPVLLLDEPLGALDLKLRQEMQVFLKGLQRDLGIAFVYVTHDQEEALTMSDRLAVFNRGPDRAGRRAGRGLRAPAHRVRRRLRRRLEHGRARRPPLHDPAREDPACSARTRRSRPGAHAHDAVVREVVYVGVLTRYLVELADGTELAVVRQNLERTSAQALEERGRRVRLEWRDEHMVAIDNGGANGGER